MYKSDFWTVKGFEKVLLTSLAGYHSNIATLVQCAAFMVVR